jgi:hypothetical protein
MQNHARRRRAGRPARRLLPLLAVVLVTSASADCPGLAGVACTQIGCSDGLSVRVLDDLTGPATVRVTANGEERTFTCDPAYACRGFFDGWSPAVVDVEVAWAGGSYAVRGVPDYELVYPNGRRCGPECRQGDVAVRAP